MNDAITDDPRPSLLRDRAFWGLNLTQFLGAFNDNLFKQLVLLLSLEGGRDTQFLAMVLFAWPFIAFSGYAGFLSDRYSKRTIIVLCKVAELGIVLLGLIGFITGSLAALLSVLCLMGVHSAFFGPSKYGILPELLRPSDLPRANGFMLMTTFLAIIFGLAAAGAAMHTFAGSLWLASLPCLAVALVGVATSLLIRPTAIAEPQLKFDWSSVAIAPDTRALLKRDRKLLGVLLISSVFWFVAGTVYPPAINAFGKQQLHLDPLLTGAMAASTGLGIAVGCVLAGILSKDRVRGWLVRVGAWGLTLSLAALCLPGPGFDDVREEIRQMKQLHIKEAAAKQAAREPSKSLFDAKVEQALSEEMKRKVIEQVGSLIKEIKRSGIEVDPQRRTDPFRRGSLLGPYGSVVALIAVGLFAGFFSVPLQVFLLASAPSDQKGRIIGAFNLLNWIGIAGSAAVYAIGRLLLVDWLELPHASLFGFAAVLMLPVALFYRPPEAKIETN